MSNNASQAATQEAPAPPPFPTFPNPTSQEPLAHKVERLYVSPMLAATQAATLANQREIWNDHNQRVRDSHKLGTDTLADAMGVTSPVGVNGEDMGGVNLQGDTINQNYYAAPPAAPSTPVASAPTPPAAPQSPPATAASASGGWLVPLAIGAACLGLGLPAGWLANNLLNKPTTPAATATPQGYSLGVKVKDSP